MSWTDREEIGKNERQRVARDFATYDDQRIVLDDLVAALYALLATWLVRVTYA